MRPAIRLTALTLAVVALSAGLVPAETDAPSARSALQGIDKVAGQAIEDFNVPGLGIAIVAGGEVVYAQGFGYRNVEKKLPMTGDSLFAIGSTTKAMTNTLLGMLVDDGKLDWDTPVRVYLPGFRLSDPLITERITPRDMVTHRSGLPRHDLLWYNNNESTRPEIIQRLAYLELSEDLRVKFQYNNLMYLTAGYLAGRLSGGTWEEMIRERLFEPLGMARTNLSVSDSQKDPDHALPYRENDDTDELELIPFRPIDLVGPAGAVNSSVKEMASWLLFNLNGGKVGGQQLVNSSTLAEIHSPHMTTGETPERPEISASTYGLGWGIDTYRGHRRVAHGGGIDGFITSVMLFPDDGVGLVAFNNRGSGLPALINQHAADLILGLEKIDWIDEALEERKKGKEAAKEAEERKEAVRVQGTSPSHPLADYAGDYEHPGYGRLRIQMDGGTLSVDYNGIAAPIEHWHYDVWSGAETEGDKTFEDQKFLFRTNVNGLIAEVVSLLEPRAEPIVFRKKTDSRLSDPDYLRGFVGTYETATGTKLKVELSGDTLGVTIPGQPRLTLEPDLSGRFVIQEARQVSIGFELDASGRAVKAILYQPSGVFEAPRIEE
jgi:CubicO group peptidase (beta-lactamase class C family)